MGSEMCIRDRLSGLSADAAMHCNEASITAVSIVGNACGSHRVTGQTRSLPILSVGYAQYCKELIRMSLF